MTHPNDWMVRVYWEDTDAGGIVYYANYLKFFERARTEWLRAKGIHQQALRQESDGIFVVHEAHVRYLHSARLDDMLKIRTTILKQGRASMRLQQQCLLPAAEGSQLLCEATIRVGWISATTQKPLRIPKELLDALI